MTQTDIFSQTPSCRAADVSTTTSAGVSITRLKAFGLFGLLCGLNVVPGPPIHAQEPAKPFSVIGEKVFTVASDDPAVIRRQPIEIHWQTLHDWAALGRSAPLEQQAKRFEDSAPSPRILRLPLFERELDSSIDTISKDTGSWSLTAGNGRVVLVWGDGHLHGSIRDRTESYRIRSTPDGPMLEAVDLSAYPQGDDTLQVPIAVQQSSSVDSPTLVDSPSRVEGAKDSGAEIDLLVIYTSAAQALAGSESAIRQLIELGVVETNTAFLSSNVETRLRLVDIVEVDYPELGLEIGEHLQRLTEPDDGVLDEIHDLRDQLGADLVAMVGASTQGGCGIGWVMPGSDNAAFEAYGFSYTATRCISPNYTFGHEIGHNLGCRHAPDDPNFDQGAFPFSFGYKDPEHLFRTIMAYGCGPGCTRLLHWSNPQLEYDGYPLGTNSQDNARTINATRTVVANFRQLREPNSGRLSWSVAQATVDEFAATLSLSAHRQGFLNGIAQVTWTVKGQTAEPGIDVAAASGVLTWQAGEGGEQTVQIPILDDALVEGDETFTVELEDPSDSAMLGDTTVLTVTLRDNDIEPFECWNTPEWLCLGDTDPRDGSGPRPGDGRFQVTVDWRGPGGTEGIARVVEDSVGLPATPSSGLLWFFSDQNWEMLVKVLDGCATNDHFWVLFAAGTDVEYQLRVTDTVRGEFRIYNNTQGTAAQAVSDTEAFAGCP